jgi:hypothetical protein
VYAGVLWALADGGVFGRETEGSCFSAEYFEGSLAKRSRQRALQKTDSDPFIAWRYALATGTFMPQTGSVPNGVADSSRCSRCLVCSCMVGSSLAIRSLLADALLVADDGDQFLALAAQSRPSPLRMASLTLDWSRCMTYPNRVCARSEPPPAHVDEHGGVSRAGVSVWPVTDAPDAALRLLEIQQ